MLRICDQSDHTQPGKPRLLPPEDDKRHSAWEGQNNLRRFGTPKFLSRTLGCK